MKFKAFAAATLASMGWAVATPASAEILNLRVCWSSCENVSNDSALVATLNIVQNGSNVDFTFTNLTSNLGGDWTTSTYISNLKFSYDGSSGALGTGEIGNYGGTTDGGPVLTDDNFSFGTFTDASLDFQVDLDLPNAEGVDRFTDGEILTWTITGVDVEDFLVSANEEGKLALVHIQALENGGSVKFVDGITTTVSEPNILALFGLGVLLMGFLRRRAIA